jgi:UDP-glucose 4-epimerase
MRALVTGGAGFIGSNMVDALLARGDEVTILDDLSTGRRENLGGALASGNAELVEGTLIDKDAVVALCERVKPEAIFHFGAQIDVRKSAADPAWDARVNVVGTINVLEGARAAGSKRVVNSSTGGAIYGEGQIIPAPEDHPVVPEAPYGLSKFCAEQYVEIFRRMHGVPGVSLRYGNVYGPRQDPLGEAGVIAIFCGKALDGGTPKVFGDGLQTRDYVFVEDVVAANLAVLENPDATGAYNVGTGKQTSVLDLANALKLDPEMAPPRQGEVQHIALDASRARVDLGWEARVSIEEGLERTLASLR